MTTWTLHTTYAYAGGRPNAETVERLSEALTASEAVVSAGDGAVHVDLTIEATEPLRAAQHALEQLQEQAGLAGGDLVGLEVLSEQQAQLRADAPALPELAGGREVAELLGVSKQRLHQLLAREDFPEPVLRLAAGPIWLVSSVRAFERQWTRRPGRPPARVMARGDC